MLPLVVDNSTTDSSLSTPLNPNMAVDLSTNSRLIYVGDADRTRTESQQPKHLPYNNIRTSKYNILTFLPRFLYEQFRRVAYVYFLLLACLNQVPQFSVTGNITSFLPLFLVLFGTAIKDAYEDYQRHKSDNQENNRKASVLQTNQFQPKPWKQIQVGEILKIHKDETIPCDLVLLSTSDPSGAAFINTINLDGENNLKTRYALQQTADRLPDTWENQVEQQAVIHCELPNLNIYAFQAKIEIEGRQNSLGPNNIVLRGCQIKNTEWIVGVAVYTGMETKVMLNNSGPPSKRSRLERRMNREIIMIAVLMVLMCSTVTTLYGLWLTDHQFELDALPYFRRTEYYKGAGSDYMYEGIGWETFFTFFKSIFVFQNMIPIALYISMELSRLSVCVMMNHDKSMYYEATDTSFQCRSLNINEDLGQIKYVFSDKTGTLTENKMVFRCASICGVDYSHGEPPVPGEVAPHPTLVAGQVWKPRVAVDTDPKLLRLLEIGKGTDEGNQAHNFFTVLAVCNTIVPQVIETSDPAVKLIDYQGESPDEQSLVYAAAAYGFVLVERTSGHVVIDIFGERQRFDVLGIHEFNSDRKRMSVVVRCPDKAIKLFVKGADSSMFNVIDKLLDAELIRATEGHLHQYSSLGLRTLVIGARELSGREFEDWLTAYEKASTTLSGRDDLLQDVAINVECNIHILGASGIEDKLQQGVPEAIECLRQAGIKVWVLTGDKQETAISIGYSCKLLTDDMTHVIINSHSKESAKKSLEDAISMSKKVVPLSSSPQNIEGSVSLARHSLALIIDGPSLVHILETELEEELFKVGTVSDVVLCCRVAPLQKAGVVSLIKKRTSDMTLSIGDGANDVSMIQMADVGIGISGQEGRQAVMASDYAMGQFRFLVPLLLVHGHWNYQRISYMILYNLYKNAIFVLLYFWYMFFCEYSLSSPVNDINALLYSAVYCALPTILVGVYDQDLSRETLLKYPKLYGAGLRDESYNFKLFALMMIDCIWQGFCVFSISVFVYRHSDMDLSSLGDIWVLAAVVLVNTQLAMDVIRWNWKIFLCIWGLTLLTFGCIYLIDAAPSSIGYSAFTHLLSTGEFWCCMFSIFAAALLPRFAIRMFREYLFPDDIRIARELEKSAKDNKDVALEGANPPTNSQT